jgi:hypothetical protein
MGNLDVNCMYRELKCDFSNRAPEHMRSQCIQDQDMTKDTTKIDIYFG